MRTTTGRIHSAKRLTKADARRRSERGPARDRLRRTLAGIRALARPQDPAPGSRTLAEILQVRLLLEPPIAELAARRAGPADLAELRMLLLCQRRDIAAGGTGRDADSAFHACLARVAGNSLLLGLVEGLALRLAQTREAFLRLDEVNRMTSLVAHEAVLEAVERRDPRAAARAMREHLARMEPAFLAPELAASWPEEPQDQPSRRTFNILD